MVSVQTLPTSAEAYQAAQRREMSMALAAIQRQWQRMPGARWRDVQIGLLAVLLTAQRRVAAPVGAYTSDVLREQGLGRIDDQWGETIPTALVGYTGDGRSVEGLIDLAPAKMREGMDRGMPESAAVVGAGKWLNLASATVLSDTARASEWVEILARPQVDGYVRMLNPPSCSRCAVLAGKFYRRNRGFERHPGCDCRHIPSSEAASGDLRLDPEAYFESLPTAAELSERYPDLTVAARREAGIYSQEDIFTKAGAEVVREGADVTRVVNARRGMATAEQNQRGWIPRGRMVRTDVYGQPVYVTKEAVTVRGSASRAATGRKGTTRLMPESIVQMATDPEDLRRLLRLHGYIR